MRTYTIELRVDFTDEEKYDTMLEMARTQAREFLSMAMLLKDKREPQISLECGDMFERNKDLTILEEQQNRGE